MKIDKDVIQNEFHIFTEIEAIETETNRVQHRLIHWTLAYLLMVDNPPNLLFPLGVLSVCMFFVLKSQFDSLYTIQAEKNGS